MDKQALTFKACVTTDVDYDTEELSLSEIDDMCDMYNLQWRLIGDILYIISWCGKWYFKPRRN